MTALARERRAATGNQLAVVVVVVVDVVVTRLG
jgi:hypothetical protein